MCGIALSFDEMQTRTMLDAIAHRGHDGERIRHFRNMHLGFRRLAIVDGPNAMQPWETDAALIAFNGEIFNRADLFTAMHKQWGVKADWFEVSVIEALMRATPAHFHRFLDGYYAIVRIDKGRQRITIARDPIGVIPLYWQKHPFAVASEKKALQKPIEVPPGATMIFNDKGKLLKKTIYDPISLHMEPMDREHLYSLFIRAVGRRIQHTWEPVTLALSGGLDSALIAAAANIMGYPLEAVTVALNENSQEVQNATLVARKFCLSHRVVKVSPDDVRKAGDSVLWALEDATINPIKRASMMRGYLVAKYSKRKVILCGEGADEIGCGYPPHLTRQGLALEWKAFSTLRSMHAINLDRVNKAGMAWTREYRTPFLDRALVLYCMGCQKSNNKGHFRALAQKLGVPLAVLDKPKYTQEEELLWQLVDAWDPRAGARAAALAGNAFASIGRP